MSQCGDGGTDGNGGQGSEHQEVEEGKKECVMNLPGFKEAWLLLFRDCGVGSGGRLRFEICEKGMKRV